MNWIQIRCILYSLALAFVLFNLLMFVNSRRSHTRLQIACIAHELVTKTNSPRLTGIGTALRKSLAEILSAPAKLSVELGDAPHADGAATARIILSNTNAQSLIIRVRPLGEEDFQVLGHKLVRLPTRGLRPLPQPRTQGSRL